MDETIFPHNHNQSRGVPLQPGTTSPALAPLPEARIHSADRGSTSSGAGRKGWVLAFERASAPFADPLTGWTGGADPYAPIRLTFSTMQRAIDFAERQGWRYHVEEPPFRRPRLQAYADRFRPDPSRPLHWREGDAGLVMDDTGRAQVSRAARRPGTAAGSDAPPASPRLTPPAGLVDETLMASFPASDPPAWTGAAIG